MTYSIACPVIPDVYQLLNKRPPLPNDTKPKHPKSTKGFQTRRPFASSQCFGRRNYKPNSHRRHRQQRAVVPSLPLLHGSSSGRVRTAKTTEIARVAADPYLIHARGTYITSLRSFNNLTAFTLDQGAFEALDNINSSNTDDTYLGPAFSNGTQTPIPANINVDWNR